MKTEKWLKKVLAAVLVVCLLSNSGLANANVTVGETAAEDININPKVLESQGAEEPEDEKESEPPETEPVQQDVVEEKPVQWASAQMRAAADVSRLVDKSQSSIAITDRGGQALQPPVSLDAEIRIAISLMVKDGAKKGDYLKFDLPMEKSDHDAFLH